MRSSDAKTMCWSRGWSQVKGIVLCLVRHRCQDSRVVEHRVSDLHCPPIKEWQMRLLAVKTKRETQSCCSMSICCFINLCHFYIHVSRTGEGIQAIVSWACLCSNFTRNPSRMRPCPVRQNECSAPSDPKPSQLLAGPKHHQHSPQNLERITNFVLKHIPVP